MKLAVCTLIVLVCGACITGEVETTGIDGSRIRPLSGGVVPDELLGMTVKTESVAKTLQTYKNTYVEALSLYSFRKGKELQATLEVARFSPETSRVPRFRTTVLGQLGGTLPQTIRYGRDRIYLTRATRQRVAVWFRDRHMFVLATRDEFDRPRTLLRELLEVDV